MDPFSDPGCGIKKTVLHGGKGCLSNFEDGTKVLTHSVVCIDLYCLYMFSFIAHLSTSLRSGGCAYCVFILRVTSVTVTCVSLLVSFGSRKTCLTCLQLVPFSDGRGRQSHVLVKKTKNFRKKIFFKNSKNIRAYGPGEATTKI